MSEKKYIGVTFSQSFEVTTSSGDTYADDTMQKLFQLRDHIYKVCDDTDFSINVDGVKELGPTSISFKELTLKKTEKSS